MEEDSELFEVITAEELSECARDVSDSASSAGDYVDAKSYEKDVLEVVAEEGTGDAARSFDVLASDHSSERFSSDADFTDNLTAVTSSLGLKGSSDEDVSTQYDQEVEVLRDVRPDLYPGFDLSSTVVDSTLGKGSSEDGSEKENESEEEEDGSEKERASEMKQWYEDFKDEIDKQQQWYKKEDGIKKKKLRYEMNEEEMEEEDERTLAVIKEKAARRRAEYEARFLPPETTEDSARDTTEETARETTEETACETTEETTRETAEETICHRIKVLKDVLVTLRQDLERERNLLSEERAEIRRRDANLMDPSAASASGDDSDISRYERTLAEIQADATRQRVREFKVDDYVKRIMEVQKLCTQDIDVLTKRDGDTGHGAGQWASFFRGIDGVDPAGQASPTGSLDDDADADGGQASPSDSLDDAMSDDGVNNSHVRARRHMRNRWTPDERYFMDHLMPAVRAMQDSRGLPPFSSPGMQTIESKSPHSADDFKRMIQEAEERLRDHPIFKDNVTRRN